MEHESITILINRFNNVIDSLIDDFKKYNLDEEAIIFITKKTRNFVGFTNLALLNVIFKVLEDVDLRYTFDDEIKLLDEIIDNIFDNINESLDVILPDEDEEEHGHSHGHSHDHNHEHHHIDVDAVQGDITNIRENLIFLKKIVLDLGQMVISVLKFQSKNIKEDQFREDYCDFKSNIKEYKQEFDEKFK
ncbi:MAG: hypothetical protein BZ138_03130 [Methanosphaera sp. rholeuAM270]|nr:MAG: hypothetical protein BZ138_03130 [Methanosphaera sp. rholeuAM270]